MNIFALQLRLLFPKTAFCVLEVVKNYLRARSGKDFKKSQFPPSENNQSLKNNVFSYDQGTLFMRPLIAKTYQ